MRLFGLFGSPNVEKMEARGDVEGLIKALGDENEELRAAAAEALGKIGEPAVEPLIAALKDRTKDVRRAAADALGAIGALEAVDGLIAVLKDEDILVREGAAEALVKISKSHVHLKDQVLTELQLLAGGDLTDVAATGTADMAKLLIEAGADVNARTPGGYTPLIIAAARGKTAVVQVLLDAGADIYMTGEDGLTAEFKAYDRSRQTDLNKHYVATYELLEGARKRIPKDSKYPEWREVRDDLSLLPPMLLQMLQKAMCLIVLEEGEERAAMIVRASKSEFRNPVDETTPVRLHIDRYCGREADIFSLYPVIYDDPNDPFFKETWLEPYDDRPSLHEEDLLAVQARKRLSLLLAQEYAWMLVVDKQDQILWARKVLYTKGQLKRFKGLAKKLDAYSGQTISKTQHMSVVQESLKALPLSQLRTQFVALLNEETPSYS